MKNSGLTEPWRERTAQAVLAAKERRIRSRIEELYLSAERAQGADCKHFVRRALCEAEGLCDLPPRRCAGIGSGPERYPPRPFASLSKHAPALSVSLMRLSAAIKEKSGRLCEPLAWRARGNDRYAVMSRDHDIRRPHA